MAIKKIYELSVDLKSTRNRVEIPVVVQGDSTEFRVRLLDDGKELDASRLSSINNVEMLSEFTKQHVLLTTGTMQGSMAIFIIQQGELYRSGQVKAMIRLSDSEDRISTLNFSYQVIPDPTFDYIPGEQDVSIFQQYIADAQQKIDEMAATDVQQLSTQLAETEIEVDVLKTSKASKSEVQSLVTNKAEKEYVDTGLSQKITKGDVAVSDINKNKGLLDQTYFTDGVKQQWAGNTPVNATPAIRSIIEKQLTAKAVKPENTSFMKTSTNLYDRNKAIRGYGTSASTGEVTVNETRSISELISITPNTTYIISGTLVRWTLYDKNGAFISTATDSGTSFTTPANAEFIRLSIPISQTNLIQFNKGNVLLPFETWYVQSDELKLKEKSVGADELRVVEKSTNLFNKRGLRQKQTYDSVNGYVANTQLDVSDPFPLKPGKEHTALAFGGTIRLLGSDMSVVASHNIGTSAFTFTSHPSTRFAIMSVQRQDAGTLNYAPKDKAQLNEGSALLPYEPFYEKFAGVTATADNTDFVTTGSNLFNKHDLIPNLSISSTTGAATENTTIDASPFIKVKSNTDYITNVWQTRVALYDKDKVFIQSITTGDNPVTFKTPVNCEYVRIPVRHGRADQTQLNEGTELLPYEPFYNKFKHENPNAGNKVYQHQFAPVEIVGEIEVTDTVEAVDGTGPSGYNHQTISVSDVYNFYDELAADFPSAITKEQIGMDESGTYPIYCYTFRPERINEVSTFFDGKPLPEIIIGGAIHGDGPDAGDKNNNVYALMFLMEDVFRNTHEQELFEYLRFNVVMKIIPLQNPWGFQNRSRRNVNGVDINRNWGTQQWSAGTVGSNDYGGTAPFSEQETRVLRDFVLANKQAVMLVDFHTTGGVQDDDKWMYFAMPRQNELHYPAYQHIKKLSAKWKQRGYGLDDSTYYGYINHGLAGKYQQWVNENTDILACVLESSPDILSNPLGGLRKDIMDMSYENVANWIVHSLKYLKEKRN